MRNTTLQSVDILTPDGQLQPGLVPLYNSNFDNLTIDERVAVNEVLTRGFE